MPLYPNEMVLLQTDRAIGGRYLSEAAANCVSRSRMVMRLCRQCGSRLAGWWSSRCCSPSVAGRELGSVDRLALGVELGRRAFRRMAAVTGLPFVVDVSEHGADECDH